jgi:hypothetical protein
VIDDPNDIIGIIDLNDIKELMVLSIKISLDN